MAGAGGLLAAMNFTAGTPFSYGQLIGQAVGVAILGVVLAAVLAGVLHTVLHFAGAWRMRPGAGRKFAWGLAVLGIGLAMLAGGGAGWQVGVGRAVVPVARELGPQMLHDGAEQALRRAGLTNSASLEVGRLRELLAQAEGAVLPPLDFPGSAQLQPQIDAVKAKLLTEARVFLDAQDKQGRLALKDALAALWPKVFDELVAGERKFRRAAIVSGVMWVAGIEAVLAVVCLVMRLSRKPVSSQPPTLPKV